MAGWSRSAVLAGLIGCLAGGPALALRAPPSPPPYQGAYQPRGVDEIGMWRDDDESERKLAASPLLIRDEALNAYIRKILCDTVGSDRCGAARIYVVREPTFNATMSPNGTMRVLSGLLLRARSEAELAAILGHEFAHFEKRHSLMEFKATRGGKDALAWGALLVSMAPSYGALHSFQNLEMSVYGSLFRYNRDQEREADMLGLGYLNASPFRPQAASAVWQNLMGEVEASAMAKGLRKPDFDSVAFTASHPPEGERAGYLAEFASPEAATRDDAAARYRATLAAWLPAFLEDQIKLNDFGASEFIIARLAEHGWTAGLWLARGDLYRARGNPRDLVNAAEFYASAIALDATLAPAFRGLGLSLLKTGKRTEGQAALRKYLELSPAAADAKMIKLMVPGENSQ